MRPTQAELEGILMHFGLPLTAKTQLLRRGTNFVYIVDGEDVILRVTAADAADNLRKQVKMVRRLSEVALVLPPLCEKVAVCGRYAATAWAKGEMRQDEAAFRGWERH